jgi:hypothetical protein
VIQVISCLGKQSMHQKSKTKLRSIEPAIAVMLYLWHLKELRVLTEPRTISDKEKSIEKLPKNYPEIQ